MSLLGGCLKIYALRCGQVPARPLWRPHHHGCASPLRLASRPPRAGRRVSGSFRFSAVTKGKVTCLWFSRLSKVREQVGV